jgi:DNA gyrase subunit A
LRDESNREGIRVVIELRKAVEPETVRRQLYKLTNIESSFGFNTLAIVNKKPKILNLKEFISEFLKFREDTVIKRVKFDLKKAEERAHILIGLATAVENIDEIIKIIKNSKDTDIAKNNLLSKKWKIKKSAKLIALIDKKKNITSYKLSIEQVNAILELRLQKLTAYGIGEIENEINKLAELIIEYNKIINSKKELNKLIINELVNIKDKFGTPRKTKIIDAVLNYNIEETIQKESVVISITNQGYIKRSPLSALKAQKRGGKGKSGISTREEDFVVQIFTANTHTPVLFFSTQGLVYKIKAHKIPEGTAASKGKSIFNILPLKSHHAISSIMPLPEDESEWKKLMVIFVTSKGNVRKNTLEDFVNINNSGKIAMKLDQDDKIIGVKICKEDEDILLSTQFGKCIRFKSKKLRLFKGRSSKGIKGIQLADKDKVISLSIIENSKIDAKMINKDKKIKSGIDKFILSVSENGFGKRTSYLEYRVTNRGGKGIIGIINSPRNGNISSSLIVGEEDEIILSTDKGSIMRCAVKEIRTAGRNTQGVRIKKLSGSEKVVSVIKIEDNIN